MKPRIKLYVSSRNMEGVFGEGKYRLLKAVQKHGSIQKAAASLQRSYRKAWGDIKRAQEGLGRALVCMHRGGTSGGSTELTEYGKKLCAAWERYRDESRDRIARCYDRHLKKLMDKK